MSVTSRADSKILCESAFVHGDGRLEVSTHPTRLAAFDSWVPSLSFLLRPLVGTALEPLIVGVAMSECIMI